MNGSDAAVVGPYTHWKELGTRMVGDSLVYRIVCAGKDSDSGQPVLLFMELDDTETKVTRIANGSGRPIKFQYDGVTAFTMPRMVSEVDCNLQSDRSFVEMLIVVAVTSTGSFCVFREGKGTPTAHTNARASAKIAARIEERHHNQQPSVLAFERLTPIGERGNVSFGGDGIGRYGIR